MADDELARSRPFELDKSKFDILPPLMDALKKMADANVTVGDQDLAEMKKTIDQLRLKVTEAEAYYKSIPGIEMTKEEQLEEIERLKQLRDVKR
ncbi:hypothetical protein HDU97_003195 [Phlyctochytrium planicorne]|nr:hypothetical protein HDU97_003195 [Phlyctochytrium planicorne]